MQQRRLRLGDIVDDYCPRERRITNHAIVAMIDDEVKQTRCTTCDADHEYKQARIPAQRRKKDTPAALYGEVLGGMPRKRTPAEEAPPADLSGAEDEPAPVDVPTAAAPPEETPLDTGEAHAAGSAPLDDEGPVHRPLYRAKLPRPEGQVPERKLPEFTIRQRGNVNGGRPGRGARRGAQARVPHGAGGGPHRFGGPRHGQPSGQGQRPNSGRPRHRGGRKRGR